MNPSAETLQFVREPTKSDFRQILAWLKNEQEAEGEGFYCNRNIIEDCFEDRRMVCGRLDGLPITFLTWSKGRRAVEILIMATLPGGRGTGLGSAFVRSVLPHLRDELGILVVELECTPPRSESFWRNHNFIDFPPGRKSWRSGIQLYKSLLGDPSPVPGPTAELEIWHRPSYEVANGEPADEKALLVLDGVGKINQQVVILAEPDWKARVAILGAVPREGKVKQIFSRSCLEGEFLVGVPVLETVEGEPGQAGAGEEVGAGSSG